MSILCPGIDVSAWQMRNTAPLYPGQMQRWVIVYDRRQIKGEADILGSVTGSLIYWFDGGLTKALTSGTLSTDTIKILRVSTDRLSFPDKVKSREDLDPIPLLAPNASPAYVNVTFAYRGDREALPWPTWNDRAWTREGSLCPNQALWMLSSVAPPLEEAPAPEPSFSEKVSQAMSEVGASAKASVVSVGVGVGIVGGAALLWWLSRRPDANRQP